MTTIQSKTPMAIAKAGDDGDIHDAGFDALAKRLMRLFRAAGWEPHAAVAELLFHLTGELTEIDYAADQKERTT